MRTRLAVLCSATALAAGALAPAQLAGATPAAAAAAYDWVALGDSYTAGVIPAAGEVFEVPRDGCERTDLSYPQVIDRDLGSLIELTNVSCGAATIEDVTFNAQQPIGRHLPPFSEDPDYPFPPVPPQSEAVNPGTDVVTVGVGGNTLGFAEILFTCLQLGSGTGGVGTPCRDDLSDNIPGRLAKVSKDYDDMLATLHERAPHAKIINVGYPTVIPQDTSKCRYNDLEQFGSITQGDLDWLRDDVLGPLNATIEKAAGEYGDAFVDLAPSTRNHSVCDAGRWVEGLFTRVPDEVAFVHPNAKGHKNAGDQVSTAILHALGVN
ncbi:SGNH/GDSL hydrolase family protein [Streptomyces sp. NBC_00555]|uniref:SGNH/GDSL hydrolase family protein n=1 Tax=Streptomyces sp. NBC_00555 TaxID=2903662 RepID=UPI00225B53A1|nr:SGNH/GDSL hydrolase family protein [Streptomyces sp. NBC_00555]MCX5010385.1 SGNH/GDSL hydrolase family protein [Streptomyces sp. NBC_00555]